MAYSKGRQMLEKDDLNIPGLMLFGHSAISKADFPLVSHIHKDALELVLVVKGNESYYVEERKFDLTGGDVFISYANQPHRSGEAKQGVCEILWFQVNPFVRQNFLGLSREAGDLLKGQLLSINTHVMQADKESTAFLSKSFDNFMKPEPGYRQHGLNLLLCFLSKLFLLQNSSENDDTLMKRVILYIEENIHNPISLEALSDISRMSVSGFKHKFKEYTGETPRDYVNYRKIQKAKELLIMNKSVTETAMLLSFNSSDYFSVVFRKYMACSPTEFIFSDQKG